MTHRIDKSPDAKHASIWEDRIQDAIDAERGGAVDAHEQQLLADHVQNCTPCRELRQRLSAVDAKLHATFTVSATLSPDFDARLFARIATSLEESLLAKRQREQNEYQTQMAQLQNHWHVGWRRRLINLFGIVATIVTLLFIVSMHFHMRLPVEWHDALNNLLHLNEQISWMSRDVKIFRLPAFAMFTSTLVAALAIWLTQRSDQQLR